MGPSGRSARKRIAGAIWEDSTAARKAETAKARQEGVDEIKRQQKMQAEKEKFRVDDEYTLNELNSQVLAALGIEVQDMTWLNMFTR